MPADFPPSSVTAGPPEDSGRVCQDGEGSAETHCRGDWPKYARYILLEFKKQGEWIPSPLNGPKYVENPY